MFFLSGYFKARHQLNISPEKIIDCWATTGMYPNNIRKVVSLSRDLVAKLNTETEKKKEELIPPLLKNMKLLGLKISMNIHKKLWPNWKLSKNCKRVSRKKERK